MDQPEDGELAEQLDVEKMSDAWAAGNNTDVTAGGADPASGSTTNSVRFSAATAKTLTLAGTNKVTSGGILVTGADWNPRAARW